MTNPSPGKETPPPAAERAPFEECCRRFETDWRAGQPLRIGQHLAAASPAELSELLRTLMAIDVRLRRAAGEQPTEEEYRQHLPDRAGLVSRAWANLAPAPAEAARTDPSPGGAALPFETLDYVSGTTSVELFLPAGPTELREGRDNTPALAPASALPVAFGRYAVRALRGQGGFGAVYAGYDSQLDRPVAIKVSRFLDSAEAIDDLLREARRVARLRHPGIVAVHDVGVQNGQCYIVSDFVDGTTLAEWLKTCRPTWQEAARIAAAVADALAHAHAQRTVHRDVKPANVILTADRAPVLVDFGLGIDESAAPGPQRGTIAGTPAYMSPEQAAGEGHRLDGRTDVYSLGALLYEMLCGRPPFRAPNVEELLRQVRRDEPQPPRQVVPDVPRELERICLKAMAKRITERYTTAADLAEDLRRVHLAPAEGKATPEQPSALAVSPPAADSSSALSGKSSATRRAREAERRQLTVLSCSLADVGALAEQLGPEEVHELLRSYQKTCAEVVGRFNGALVQSLGDSLLVCFGYPVAYEDNAPRAVRTGLALVEELARARKGREKHGSGLAVRVGIHTGLVVAGEMVGETGEPLAIVGEARTVASGLESAAAADSVVLSAATFRLVQGLFDCEPLGEHAVRGVSRPVSAYRALREKELASRIEWAGPGELTPLVGRDREVGLLLDRWELVEEGRGQVVLLSGEPGIGKSRLVHVLEEHVARGSGTVMECRCAPQYQNRSLSPVTDYLQRHLGFRHKLAAEERLARLERLLADLRFALPEAVPLFAALLSLPPTDRYPAPALTPERQKQKTLEVLIDWLRKSSEQRPVLFVVEDLHWVDASTRELLGLLIEQAQTERVFVLLTFRPEFAAPWSGPHLTQVALPRLSRRQVAEMVGRKSGNKPLPPEVAEQVAARTDGVPLFVEECTRLLLESGLLREVEGAYVLTGPLRQGAIPSTLHDLLMARLDRLDTAKEVAQFGAALGREFSHELIQAASPLDAPVLEAELAKLVEAELLFRKGRPPQASYLFKHALVQDAAYQSLLKSTRQQYHRRIAEALEARYPETVEAQPELLAHHCTEAGLAEQAIALWEKAGHNARERSASAEAVGHLSKGLELLAGLEEAPERVRQELQLQAALGTALLASKGYSAPEAGPVFARARALCEQTGEKPHLFAVMWGAWAWHVVRGDFRLCMDLGAEMLELARSLQDPGITMEAHFAPALTLLYRGDHKGSRDHCERGLALDDRERCKLWARHTGQNSGVTHRCYLALALWHLGHPDQALALSRETVALAREVAHPFSLEYALHHAGWLYQHCRLGREAQALGEEQLALAVEQGFAMWRATGVLYRAAGLVLQGRHEEALPQLQQGLTAYRALGAELALPFYLSILAEAHAKAGQTEEGLSAVAEALALAAKNDDRFQEPELHRARGELLLSRSADEEAEACFRHALDVARRQGSKAWELRSAMSLSRLWQRQGKRAEARQALGEVCEWFTEGAQTPDLIDARALLEALG